MATAQTAYYDFDQVTFALGVIVPDAYAEDGGIDSLWLYDHLIFRMPDEAEDGIHEATTLLAAVAAVTTNQRL